MELKSQDLLVLLKLVVYSDEPWSYSRLASDLSLSSSMVHSSVKRAQAAKLFEPNLDPPRPARSNLKEFLLHGAKYSFPAEIGAATRGIPTGYAAPPLNDLIAETLDLPPVWPHPQGAVRGLAFSPLHEKAPGAALKDGRLYELLALLDAIRGGRAREREIAARELSTRVSSWR